MCLIIFSYKQHTEFPFVLVANRDEFFGRATEPLRFWESNDDILAGRDLESGGTWLGITHTGRFAALTNYRDTRLPVRSNARSRGLLVTDFLQSSMTSEEFAESIRVESRSYAGFNLLIGDQNKLIYFSNATGEGVTTELSPGYYGLSNHLLNTPWQKVERAKHLLQKPINQSILSIDDMIEKMLDQKQASSEELPDTGLPIAREQELSSIFIKMAGYGTRSTSVLTINKSKQVMFVENVHGESEQNIKQQVFEFQITE